MPLPLHSPTLPQSSSVPEHPFLSHLAVLLSIYDLDPNPRSAQAPPQSLSPAMRVPGLSKQTRLSVLSQRLHIACALQRKNTVPFILGHPAVPDSDYLSGTLTVRRPSHDLTGDPFEHGPHLRVTESAGAPNPMQISQEGLQHVSDPTHFHRFGNLGGSSTDSSPASPRPSPYHCPTCRHPVPLSVMASSVDGHTVSNVRFRSSRCDRP